jgi:hypothetical protein
MLASACGGSSGGNLQRFCELARERERKQPTIDFEKASQSKIKAAFSSYIKAVADNVAEAKRVAPQEIRADFVKGVDATREVAQTGDVRPFMESRAARRVGEYLAKECGIDGP